MRRLLSILSAALAAWSCTWGADSTLGVASVSPPVVANDIDMILVVRGAGFVPSVAVDFDDPVRSDVAATFGVELHRGGAPVLLQEVTVVSPEELHGRLQAGTSPGNWDVVVLAPDGGTRTLAGGLKVRLTTCLEAAGPCDDRNPCTEPDTCQGLTCESGPAVADGTPCEIVCIDRTLPGTCGSGTCAPDGDDC